MAELKFKQEVKDVLKDLLLPDLVNIVNQFVQITSIHTKFYPAKSWKPCQTTVYQLGVAIPLGKYDVPVMDWRIGNEDYYAAWAVNWIGPEIETAFDARQVEDLASAFDDNDQVVFSFSDSNNFSLDLIQ
jgi:hypothetical protein